jgi:tetratricopeptide (TPR) repeat protein
MEILNFYQILFLIILVVIMVFVIGRMSWQEGWKQFEKHGLKEDTSSLISRANKLIDQADSKEKVIELINIYEDILKIETTNQEALVELYNFCFLFGYGYTDNKEEKTKYYLKTIKYSEQFMYSNPGFKLLADKGERTWEACRVLSTREMEAMGYWYLAVGAYWKECRGVWGKLINIQWPIRIKKVLVRMMAIDPKWLNGIPYYLWANYYAVAPGIVGGDLKKAEEYYKKAIELGPNMLNYRRSRAYFFYTKMKDRESFKRDLEWVISQDPHKAGLSYPWNAFIQRDVKKGLANIDNYFR